MKITGKQSTKTGMCRAAAVVFLMFLVTTQAADNCETETDPQKLSHLSSIVVVGQTAKSKYFDKANSMYTAIAVKKTFQTIDLNGDGLISEDELFQALHAIDSSLTRQDAKSIMLTVDANSNGVLEYDELLSSRINRKLISKEERMRKVFRCLDVDGSGTLTAQEIQGALMSIHEGIDIKQCQKLIAEADKNNDNVIDYEEWIEVFRNEDGMFGALASGGDEIDEKASALDSLGL